MRWIEKQAILANLDVQTWQDAVRETGKLLVKNNLVTEQYIEAMVETTKELGAYCVIAPGIAIPHAQPEKGVLKTGYSAITLKNPVNFGNPDNDPVHLIIGFCAIDHQSHIQSLTCMANAISSEGFMDRIKNVKTDHELDQALNG